MNEMPDGWIPIIHTAVSRLTKKDGVLELQVVPAGPQMSFTGVRIRGMVMRSESGASIALHLASGKGERLGMIWIPDALVRNVEDIGVGVLVDLGQSLLTIRGEVPPSRSEPGEGSGA